MITTVGAASDRALSPADSTQDTCPSVTSDVFQSPRQPSAVPERDTDTAIDNLHAEISNLQSARQTDAYLLQVKEREILELRNLLQERAKSDNSAVFNPVCSSPGKDWRSPSSGNNSFRSRQEISFRGTSCTEESSVGGTSADENRPDRNDLQGFDCHLVTDVTKICDSPIMHLPQSTLSKFSAGVSMERTAAVSATLNPGASPPDTNIQEQVNCKTDLNSCIASRIPLSIIVPQVPHDAEPQASPSPPDLTTESLHKEKTSPVFNEQGFLLAGREANISSSRSQGYSSSDIWGKFSGSQTFRSSNKPRPVTTQSGTDGLQDEGASFIGRIFDQECVNRFGKHISKFNLDPTSPAYIPSFQYHLQQRPQSVPASVQNDVGFSKSPWSSGTPQGTFYTDFDDFNEQNGYPAGDGDFAGSRSLASGYLSNGFVGNGEYEDYPSMPNDCSEFGDALQYQILVDKIVQTNDQPASLHLQQSMKHLSALIQSPTTDSATTASAIRSRNQLMDAVKPQALPLMRNRFGNFLMQRCLEYGTREQVKLLVGLMVGQVYSLSCDRFGCHVVQKALDVCEDEMKHNIVAELFRSIPETVTHRFACHVWQRVFETRWGVSIPSSVSANAVEHFPLTSNLPETASPSQVQTTYATRTKISARVDAALKGQWHLVANDENGSLVVQCIFENCVDSDKREIVKEVLVYAADIAKGQWGNWVIQHLLDHGTPVDKSLIFKVVARNVYNMSVDQFASKVVEKVLKSCQRRELYDIVDVVINPVMRDNGCPGILDMMNNQYANYVVQNILTLSEPSQREICVRLIAPHLSVLRGSKYGQRVAAIVEKHIRTHQHRFNTIPSSSANPVAGTINALNQFNRAATFSVNGLVNNTGTNPVTGVNTSVTSCGMIYPGSMDFDDTCSQTVGHCNPSATNSIVSSLANLSLQQIHQFQPTGVLNSNSCNTNGSSANNSAFLLSESSSLYFQQQQQQHFQHQIQNQRLQQQQSFGTSPTSYGMDGALTSQIMSSSSAIQGVNILKHQQPQTQQSGFLSVASQLTPLLPQMTMQGTMHAQLQNHADAGGTAEGSIAPPERLGSASFVGAW
ncbi:hypothetical protein HDU83_001169 [Entophlyctis luteolus]|nr:hypothetical protein HDU83_001169 [Entophlyctis luteolus]KAJ3394977.1 hypothetical protein HDU84_004435 [Entophlyctis sp. JEL0112]